MTVETRFNIGDEVCPFCQGTGRCKSLDLNRLPEGSMSMNDAIDKFGEETECVDGCFEPRKN